MCMCVCVYTYIYIYILPLSYEPLKTILKAVFFPVFKIALLNIQKFHRWWL